MGLMITAYGIMVFDYTTEPPMGTMIPDLAFDDVKAADRYIEVDMAGGRAEGAVVQPWL